MLKLAIDCLSKHFKKKQQFFSIVYSYVCKSVSYILTFAILINQTNAILMYDRSFTWNTAVSLHFVEQNYMYYYMNYTNVLFKKNLIISIMIIADNWHV